MNEVDLKDRVGFYTQIGGIVGLIIVSISALLIPQCERTPYTPKVEKAVKAIDLPPQLKQLKEPPPPPKPKLPVAAKEGEKAEQATIERTDFTGFEKAPPKVETEEKIYEFWAVEEPPVLLKQYYVEPEYPDFAKKAGIEGNVYLRLVVDTAGMVADIKVLKSLHPLCDQAAIQAVRQWRFTPAKQRGVPVKVYVDVPLRFSLEE